MPKNLKGGYQVIDLRNIDLTLTAEAQNITDAEVLEQLATLRDYIEPSHNYAKPLKKKLKPILVSIRDKKSDEEQESSIWANLSVYDDELSYKIEAVVDNSPLKVLQINVVFELVTEEDGSTHYEIDTATMLLSELVKMGDINVEGITSKGIANTGGLANIGDVAISGDLSATGDATVGGDLSVTGKINGEENPSLKPLYLHSCLIRDNSTGNWARITCLLFTNDATPLTNDTFKALVKDIIDSGNIIQINGAMIVNTVLYNVYTLSESSYQVYGVDYLGNQSSRRLDDITFSNFSDNVRKIN